MALSGMAMGVETKTLDECILGKKADFILTLNLDASAISTLLPNLNDSNEGVVFATVESGSSFTGLAMGKWGTGDVYLQTPGKSGQLSGGLGATTSNGVTVNGQSLTESASSTLTGLSFTNMAGTDWSKVDSAVLTLRHEGSKDLSTATLTLTVDDAVYTVIGATSNSDRAWDTYAATTTLKYNTNFVTSASFLAVPEPTTATLSLLALAGLAARRRRK